MSFQNQIPVGMPPEHQGYRDTREYRGQLLRSVWPYVAVSVLVFGISVLAAQDPTWPLFAAGWAVAAACIAIAYLHPQLWLVAPFGAVGSVLLIRWGTDGLASGVGPLLLVPVLGVALYGSRRTLAAMLILTGLAVVGVHFGSNHATLVITTVWRQDLIMLTMAVVLAVAINHLVIRLRTERQVSQDREAQLMAVTEITKAVSVSGEPARSLCHQAVALTEATGAVLFRGKLGEPDLLAWENADPEQLKLMASGPVKEALARSAIDGEGSLRICGEGSWELESLRSAWLTAEPAFLILAPVHLGQELAGLLILAWPEGSRPEFSPIPLELLAAEASTSVRNFELIEQLEQKALTDPLTGVSNRRGWEQQIVNALRVAGRHQRPISLAILDLDGFKTYNDRHGHQAGDRLLLESVDHWRKSIRAGDLLARFGGDEFLVTLPETGLGEARVVVERLTRGTSHSVGCSAGIAEWNGSEPVEELLGRADRALYTAKAAGPGSVHAISKPAADRPVDLRGQRPGTQSPESPDFPAGGAPSSDPEP